MMTLALTLASKNLKCLGITLKEINDRHSTVKLFFQNTERSKNLVLGTTVSDHKLEGTNMIQHIKNKENK